MSLRWSWIPFVTLACATASPMPTPAPTAAPAPAPAELATAPITVVVVRHGEKTGEQPDAGLSELGRARARCLSQMLVDAGVDAVLSSEVARTRDTVEPTATRAGLTVEPIPAADEAAMLARLRELPPGSVALVGGHSNTVPSLIAALSGQQVSIAGDEYDRMFVLELVDGRARSLLALRYCQPPA